jgi:hypothetical protein
MTATHKTLEDLVDQISDPQASELVRRRSLDRLLSLLQRHPKLLRSSHSDYLDALDRTWEWVSRSLHEFKPKSQETFEVDLLRWVNGHLKWRLKDVLKQPLGRNSLDRHVEQSGEPSGTRLDQISEPIGRSPTLSGLDQLVQEEMTSRVQELKRYIINDPDGKLRDCHPRKYPRCHAQWLAQQLLLSDPPRRIADISREVGIHYQTLKSHWEQKCKPLLREIAISRGFSPTSDDSLSDS